MAIARRSKRLLSSIYRDLDTWLEDSVEIDFDICKIEKIKNPSTNKNTRFSIATDRGKSKKKKKKEIF